jgi:hypothetical protein
MADTGEPPHTDTPLYWLVILDQAVQQGEHQAAAEAQRELARLGVQIHYGRPRPARQGRRPTCAQDRQAEGAHV